MCIVFGKPKSGTENDKKNRKWQCMQPFYQLFITLTWVSQLSNTGLKFEHAFLETENPPSYDNVQEGKNSNRQLTITATAQMRSRTQTIPRQTHAAVNASQQNQQSYSVHM